MAKITLRQLRDPAAQNYGVPDRCYGNDKTKCFSSPSENDAKTPSSSEYKHYIISVPVDAVPPGNRHDFRQAEGDLRRSGFVQFAIAASVQD